MSKEQVVIKQELYYHTKPDNSTRSKKRQIRRKTIAGIVTTDNKLRIGIAECDFGDNFSKLEGRNKSRGRAISARPAYEILLAPYSDSKANVDFFLEIARKFTGRSNDLV